MVSLKSKTEWLANLYATFPPDYPPIDEQIMRRETQIVCENTNQSNALSLRAKEGKVIVYGWKEGETNAGCVYWCGYPVNSGFLT